jgi:ribosomal protein RSM22 (predicted rRNA methylase)
MQLPNDLRLALERELRTLPATALTRAARALSERYRAGELDGAMVVRTPEDAAAYAALRMPATFAAITAALRAALAALPAFAPQRLLDVGSGSGAALWAAATQLASLHHATLIEQTPTMQQIAQRLAAHAQQTTLPAQTWQRTDLRRTALPPADLVTMAYALGELPAADQPAALTALWAATQGLLLIVEPGTPSGFAVIRAARSQLLAAGAQIVAPCPHAHACPMPATDWCHFAQRIARTRIQQAVKGAVLAYEDEKFAYIALSREPAHPAASRIVRHPQQRKGHSELQLCTPTGLQTITISRSHPNWQQARKSAWGDPFIE